MAGCGDQSTSQSHEPDISSDARDDSESESGTSVLNSEISVTENPEAITFYQAIESEGEFDVNAPLSWGFMFARVKGDQVPATVSFLRENGFSDIEPLFDDAAEDLFVVAFYEQRIHTEESFADRVQMLVSYAQSQGFQLDDWNVGKQ